MVDLADLADRYGSAINACFRLGEAASGVRLDVASMSHPFFRKMVADNSRRVRFRGVERNQLGLSLRIAAINLRRMINLGLDHDGEWRLGSD